MSLVSCQRIQENKIGSTDYSKQNQINKQDNLFKLDIKLNENFVFITKPNNSDFEFPDKSAKTEPFKLGDFNADDKEDVLVNMGACGIGGCIYGLFLSQYDNYYQLAYMDYLKNPEFIIEKNGLWAIKISEEIEPYNPSKLVVTILKFDKNKYQYESDTTYVYIDNE